jgi:hypothetical protein
VRGERAALALRTHANRGDKSAEYRSPLSLTHSSGEIGSPGVSLPGYPAGRVPGFRLEEESLLSDFRFLPINKQRPSPAEAAATAIKSVKRRSVAVTFGKSCKARAGAVFIGLVAPNNSSNFAILGAIRWPSCCGATSFSVV